MPSSADYFQLGLCVTAWVVLWGGVGGYDGMVSDILRTIWYQKFPDLKPFRLSYTGLLPLDYLMSTGVAFFYEPSVDPLYRIFLVHTFTNLGSIVLLMMMEGLRPGVRPAVKNTALWGYLSQLMGGGCFMPIFFYLNQQETVARGTPPSLALSLAPYEVLLLIPALLVGSVLPMALAFLNPVLPRTSDTHQILLFIWLFWPVYLQYGYRFLTRILGTFHKPQTRQLSDKTWSSLQLVYSLSILLSFTGNAYFSLSSLQSTNPLATLRDTYLSELPVTAFHSLRNVSVGFLQWDWFFMVIPSIFWAATALQRDTDGISIIALLGVILIGGVLLGAGGVTSVLMWWREAKLRRSSAQKLE